MLNKSKQSIGVIERLIRNPNIIGAKLVPRAPAAELIPKPRALALCGNNYVAYKKNSEKQKETVNLAINTQIS